MIKELLDKSNLPWHLLLDADPDREVVAKYLAHSRIFVCDTKHGIAGIVVLASSHSEQEFELMNVSVDERYRRQGIAKKLIAYVIGEISNSTRLAILKVKTGDLSIEAISLYQSLGFERIEMIKNYFIDHYHHPIYEHGERLRHQVVMQLKLP